VNEDLFKRFNTDAKRVLELSLREALSKGHNYIGIEAMAAAVERVRREARCPCKDPKGAEPCTPEQPCPYAMGRIKELWSKA